MKRFNEEHLNHTDYLQRHDREKLRLAELERAYSQTRRAGWMYFNIPIEQGTLGGFVFPRGSLTRLLISNFVLRNLQESSFTWLRLRSTCRHCSPKTTTCLTPRTVISRFCGERQPSGANRKRGPSSVTTSCSRRWWVLATKYMCSQSCELLTTYVRETLINHRGERRGGLACGHNSA